MELYMLLSAGLSHQAERCGSCWPAERWERDPRGQGKLSTSTSVDIVRGPGLPQAPDALQW